MLQGDSLNHKVQFSFWEEDQIPKRIRIKIPGSKLSLNFGLIYWGFKPLWKTFGKFPKILSCLNLEEYKFRWP
jgi:hypothetical protein